MRNEKVFFCFKLWSLPWHFINTKQFPIIKTIFLNSHMRLNCSNSHLCTSLPYAVMLYILCHHKMYSYTLWLWKVEQPWQEHIQKIFPRVTCNNFKPLHNNKLFVEKKFQGRNIPILLHINTENLSHINLRNLIKRVTWDITMIELEEKSAVTGAGWYIGSWVRYRTLNKHLSLLS